MTCTVRYAMHDTHPYFNETEKKGYWTPPHPKIRFFLFIKNLSSTNQSNFKKPSFPNQTKPKKTQSCLPMARTAFSVVVVVLLLLFIGLSGSVSAGRDLVGDILRLPSEASRFFGRGRGADVADDNDDDSSGTKWAVLIAGSNGYWNYRHQVIYLFFFFTFQSIFVFSIFLNLLISQISNF